MESAQKLIYVRGFCFWRRREDASSRKTSRLDDVASLFVCLWSKRAPSWMQMAQPDLSLTQHQAATAAAAAAEAATRTSASDGRAESSRPAD